MFFCRFHAIALDLEVIDKSSTLKCTTLIITNHIPCNKYTKKREHIYRFNGKGKKINCFVSCKSLKNDANELID